MSGLAGVRVLAVEDEAVLAFALEDMLIDLGCQVIGPALRLSDGMALIERDPPDAAVLDVNIAGDRSYPIADELERRGVPFLFATGYGNEGVELRRTGARVLAKPYRQRDLEAELIRLLAEPADEA